MRQMTWRPLLLATLLVPWAAAGATEAAPSERALREECSAFSQAGMRACLAAKATESQQRLTQAEEAAASAITRWDEDLSYTRAALAKLAASSKDFSRYRGAQCAFAASLRGGGAGNAHEMGRLACVAELNGRRAAQLRDAVSDLPPK